MGGKFYRRWRRHILRQLRRFEDEFGGWLVIVNTAVGVFVDILVGKVTFFGFRSIFFGTKV